MVAQRLCLLCHLFGMQGVFGSISWARTSVIFDILHICMALEEDFAHTRISILFAS